MKREKKTTENRSHNQRPHFPEHLLYGASVCYCDYCDYCDYCVPSRCHQASIVAFLAMADISDEHRRVAMAAGRDACANIEAACQTKCEATIRVAMKDWCSGSRQCHATCMLRQFYTQTGDWRFKQKADRCAGRCVAWDLCQEGASNSAEWWHGWQFVKNQDIDMKILGLHAEHCPLNGLRNIFQPSYMLRCGAIVLKQSENSLSVAFQRLHKYFTEISTADLNEVWPARQTEYVCPGVSVFFFACSWSLMSRVYKHTCGK